MLRQLPTPSVPRTSIMKMFSASIDGCQQLARPVATKPVTVTCPRPHGKYNPRRASLR
jgi:hypothetical protein